MEGATKRVYKRRNYFIDKDFQTKFIIKFCLLLIIGGLLTVGILYYLSTRSTTVAIVNSRVVVRSTADFLLPLLVQTVLIVTVIASLATIAVTLFVSHKIAGPLYRFKKALLSLSEGDFSFDFHIRWLDQFQDLAEAFNMMLAKLRQRLNAVKDNVHSAKEKMHTISEHEVAEQKRPSLNEVKHLIELLNTKISFFKS